MTTLPQLTRRLQAILIQSAEEAARATAFTLRRSKLTGSVFVQTLVFGFLTDPPGRLRVLSEMAARIGQPVSPQGLSQRFTERAAACLRQVLDAVLSEAVGGEVPSLPLLRRFTEVALFDSTVVRLPDGLKDRFPGCGGSGEGLEAALKLSVKLDYRTGALTGSLLPGRAHDQTDPSLETLPPGALRVADLGFFNLKAFARMDERGVYWLTRWKTGVNVFVQGEPVSLAQWLKSRARQTGDRIEADVLLGCNRLPGRLFAIRVPPEVFSQRKARLHEEARKKRQPVSDAQLALAKWTILVTNAPSELLSFDEAFALARARWQIELLFKLWKSEGRIDEWRTQNPARILCEVYAKLIAGVLLHGIVLVSGWDLPDRSVHTMADAIRRSAAGLAESVASFSGLLRHLERLRVLLRQTRRVQKRHSRPATFQRLLELS